MEIYGSVVVRWLNINLFGKESLLWLLKDVYSNCYHESSFVKYFSIEEINQSIIILCTSMLFSYVLYIDFMPLSQAMYPLRRPADFAHAALEPPLDMGRAHLPWELHMRISSGNLTCPPFLGMGLALLPHVHLPWGWDMQDMPTFLGQVTYPPLFGVRHAHSIGYVTC